MLFKDMELKELNPRDLTDAELREYFAEGERRHMVEQKKLYHHCSERACRRLRECAAEARCICAGVPAASRRERKRLGLPPKQTAMRFW